MAFYEFVREVENDKGKREREVKGMVEYIKGNLFHHIHEDCSLILFSANSVINSYKNELVMGAGIAKAFKNRWPSLPGNLAYKVKHLSLYGLAISDITINEGKTKLGAFQSKIHYRDDSSIEILKYSVDKLKDYCDSNPRNRVLMNMPAIGFGNLSFEVVKRITNELSSQVIIYHY